MYDEHRHVVVLLMADEHMVKQVLQQPSRSAEQTVPGRRGLANLADRVNALDGEILIDRPPGEGTRLVVRVPSVKGSLSGRFGGMPPGRIKTLSAGLLVSHLGCTVYM
jgi:hypothetical protein